MRDVRTCMPMKNILHVLVLVLGVAMLLTACESGKKETDKDGKAEKSGVESAATASNATAPKAEAPAVEQSAQSASPAPSPAELEKADRLVAFSNAASMALAAGRYAQADVLMAYTKYYLAEWQLAKRPAISPDEDEILARRLVPPAGLFTPEQTKKMAASVQEMNKAIASMRADYRSLEKYVEDAQLQDDGAKGKALGAGIAKAHASFVVARDAYMQIVEAEAAPAEDILLSNHPLKRQIQAAERIFAVFGKAASLLAPDKPDREALQALRQELAAALADGARPPFMAAPDLERRYRGFLKQAENYAELFDQGLNEEFYAPLRFEMNKAAVASRTAYNDFVRDANKMR